VDCPRPPPHLDSLARGLTATLAGATLILGLATNHAAAEDTTAIEPQAPSLEAADTPAVAPPSNVEIMRVTGRKVMALEAEVPASVTQFDAATLHALGAQNIADVSKFTPNVEIRTAGATAASFFIRGVGLQDFSANAASAVAIYGDDIPLNAPALQLGGLFDLENIEVQRGPQGAGSGRNASAGAIRLHSRKPSGEIGGVLRASLGSYFSDDARDALIQTYEGAVETPILEGVLASRFAFRLREAAPFMTNGCGSATPVADRGTFDPRGTCSENPAVTCRTDRNCANAGAGVCIKVPKAELAICSDNDFQNGEASRVPEGLPDYVGDRHDWAARGQFRFEPPRTDSTWLLNLHGSRLDQQSTLGQASGTGGSSQEFGGSAGNGRYTEPDQAEELAQIQQELPSPEFSQQDQFDVLGLNLTQNRPLDIRPYRGDYNRVGQTKLDTWGGFVSGDIEIGPLTLHSATGYDGYERSRDSDSDFTSVRLFELLLDDQAWQVSQELRIDGELDDSFQWEMGGFYLQEDLQAKNDLLISLPGQAETNANRQVTRDFTQDLWSFGVWAGFVWDFLDDFTLEAGARYNWERKDFDIHEVDNIRNRNGVTTASSQSQTWQAPTGLISLTYRFGDTASAYWKYSRGFKAGHFNSNSADEPPAKAETIDSFETGMRGAWLDDRIRLRGSFFYYKYSDYQVFVFEDNPGRPPTLEIINANDAQVYGVEVDADIRPLSDWAPDALDDLLVSLRFGWLEGEYLDFTDTVLRTGTGAFPAPVTFDFTGNPLINSPRLKVSGTVQWPFELGYWGTLTPRYDFTWSDDIYFNPQKGRGVPSLLDGEPRLPDYAIGQPGFILHNLTLTYLPPEGNIEISGWVRNLLDERYKTYAFDASQFSKIAINFVGEPRTIGADISIRW
jgi:iron complex outermembrane receptor protein